MLEALKAWSGFVLVLIFFSIILATLFIWVGIKAMGIEDISLKKIIVTTITASLVIYFVTIILSSLPFIGTIPGYVIGLFLSLLIIKLILSLTLQQSLGIWIINVTAQVISIYICARLFIGGIKDLIKII